MGITTCIIIVKIISLHRKNAEVGKVKKSLATYAFIGEMASKELKNDAEMDKRIWKTVKSQGKVMEKSGNFKTNNEWQP